MKREMSGIQLAMLSALYFSSILNIAFWQFVWTNLSVTDARAVLFLLSLPTALFLAFYCIFCLLLWPYIGKGGLAFLLITSSVAGYFMIRLKVIIDSEMMRNVFEAMPYESLDMVTFGGIGWVAIFGLLPAVCIMNIKIVYSSSWHELKRRLMHVVVAGALFCVIGLLFYKDYSIVARNNRLAGHLLTPFNFISSTRNYLRKTNRRNAPFLVIDEEPNHVPYEDPYYTVLILMIGETARAMNFSLNGYERETNPRLSQQDIIYFPEVTSSGTATAFSLPCMFSHLPRKSFDVDVSHNSENLLDIMQKAGYSVIWLDNDGGSKGVSDRVLTIDLMKDGNPEYRNGDTFFDEVLLDGLEERLSAIDRDTVIVLHMMGSHGPSYHLRYPDAFRVFTPTCETNEIQSRTREEVINTYDNTILYTDHVVSEAIDILKRFPIHEAGLLYVSDHGESLGENGFYLHGFPFAFAPREQIHIPMILWMSEKMRREDHIDYEKLKSAAASLNISHDNLFHSILGLVEIDTELYDPELDLFKAFRTKDLPY